MSGELQNTYLAIVGAPFIGGIAAGVFGKAIGRSGAHWAAIIGVAIAFVLSLLVFQHIVIDAAPIFDGTVYSWAFIDGIAFEVGFLIDPLSSTLMVVVTFVSLMVHVYTIGYMHDDPGYQRFFSYIALFTFAMLMLVMSNNFLQLFFGWEAVGLMSYLLIGFWYERESAIFANLKAFLVNRVGDFGFALGIALILMYFGSFHYATVFEQAPLMQYVTVQIFDGVNWSLLSVICILLFIGAMGKSAQVPLHVWLPDSMEGPTPISALIHAATMVTAGIFMVARMSPLYELSESALSFVMVIGAITALFMGLVGLVQNDIKRVVAYSTLSQLGYMVVALGASAYAAAIFHLLTHAFFKALLFLAAGSVIIALHHDQDIRNMGGLRRYMPITWLTFLVGSLALIAFPGSSGFFSKEAIIEAVHLSELPGSGFAYACVLIGALITALYTFRLYFIVFHGSPRMDEHARAHVRESPYVMTAPLLFLAVPAALVGWPLVEPMLFGEYFGSSIMVLPAHDVLAEMGRDFHGEIALVQHSVQATAVWLAVGGVILAWFLYWMRPAVPGLLVNRFRWLYVPLERKFWADEFNQFMFARGARGIGDLFWRVGDVRLIDSVLVNGSAYAVGRFSGVLRQLQSGYLYHYAFAMILGLLGFLSWFLWT
ncbi:MAG: NADH-quinone oxidoreductase subunit L [Gammaproteobacteria bacterium]